MDEATEQLRAKGREIIREHGMAIGVVNPDGSLDIRPPTPEEKAKGLGVSGPAQAPPRGLGDLLTGLFATAGMKRRVGGKAVPLADPKIRGLAADQAIIDDPSRPPAAPRRDSDGFKARIADRLRSMRRRAGEGSLRR